MKEFRNLIGGEWVTSSNGATFENRNPAKPEEVLGLFPSMTREDTRRAIECAREALNVWAKTPPPVRGTILFNASRIVDQRLEEIAIALTREEGKTLAEARAEVIRARDILRYYAGEGWRMNGTVLPSNTRNELLYTRREPLGVVSIITPWNFPLAIPAWKIAPALVYGNTVVFKPASLAPHCSLMMVEALVEAGLPPGVLNYVTGAGGEVGDEMVTHPDVNGVSFTGSYEVGVQIYAKATPGMKRVQLEMGGKNALVVLDDADIDLAVQLAVRGGFGLTGQACTATSRVIVLDEVAERFVEALCEAARVLRVGDGLDSSTQMGPAVSEDQMETDLEYVEIGKAEGAKLLVGGGIAKGGGYFVQPTVFDFVEPQMRIAQEEIFGPIIAVIRARNFDDAIVKTNAVTYGLVAGIVTTNLQRALTFAEEADVGVVKINEPTTGLALQAPFGGFKCSSANTFKEQGQSAIEFYTRLKTVYLGY